MVDIDVTDEILSLSKEGVSAMKELIKFAGLVGYAGWKIWEASEEKKQENNVLSGIVNFRDFEKATEGQETEVIKLEKTVDRELLNESMKKFDVAVFLEENSDFPKMHYGKNRLKAVGLALKDYEARLLEKERAKGQHAEEKEGMTESQVENVRENNRTADQLFFMDEEKKQQVPFLYSILDEVRKERINEAQLHGFQKDGISGSRIKETLTPPEGLSGKEIKIGEENNSLNQILNKLRLTGDAGLDRSSIAEKICAEIPKGNFISLLNNKAICFLDNEDHFVCMDLENYIMKADSLEEGQKERIQDIFSVISEQKKNIRTDLDMTLPKGVSEERKRFIQEMYECCILSPDILKNDANAIRNYMVSLEEKKDLTWKDVLLWEIAKEGQFEYAMIGMDVEQIENIYAAKLSGIPNEYIQHMIRYEFSADQMRGTIDMLNHHRDLSIQSIDALAGEIDGKQERIKEALIRGYTEAEVEKKLSFDQVKEKITDEKLKFMAFDEVGMSRVESFVPGGNVPDHQDENGVEWFEAYRNPYGDRIFVNGDKSEIKYEVKVDSETLSEGQRSQLGKQQAVYEDQKGVKYYKNKGNLINENGKSVRQIKAPYQIRKPAEKEEMDMSKNMKGKTEKER